MIINKILNLVAELDFEPVKLTPEFCTRFRSSRSQCRLCQDNCPQEAIDLEKLKINYSACINCGQCYNSCPNGAFKTNFASNAKLIAEADKIKDKGFNSLNLACKRAKLSFKERRKTLHLNCLARLSETLLLYLSGEGFSYLQLKTGDCKKCNLQAGNLISAVINNLEAIFSLLGIKKQVYLNSLPEKDLSEANLSDKLNFKQLEVESSDFKQEQSFGRRKVLDIFKEQIKKEFSKSADNQTQKQLSKTDKKIFVERKFIFNLIKCYNINKEEIKDIELEKQDLFWQIKVNNNCSFCGSCAKLCPLGALNLVEATEKKELKFTPALCSGCQLCVNSCSSRAIKVESLSKVENLFPLAKQRIKLGKINNCSNCGTEFFTADKSDEAKCFGCLIQERVRKEN